jgi:hypothetical protein
VTTAARYEQLCELAKRELELIAEGAVAGLHALHTRRAELIARLPAMPPADARPALERCALLQRRVHVELLRAREALLIELAEVDRGRRAASGYAPAQLAQPRYQARA